MKRLTGLLAALLIAMVAVAAEGNGKKSTFTVDTKASKVQWVGKKVSGEHAGYVLLNEGSVVVKNNKVVSANIHMDMNSIEVTDLEGEWKDKLVAHLKNDDFFSVDKFPKANFEITSVKGKTVVGELTIKGISHEISFPADIKINGNTLTANGTAVIDRTKWDIRYGSGKFFSDLGDRMILDEFEIKFELSAKAN